ncbi:MAG: heat-inducible transcription repressor HrcA [Clostridia bacterium]|nr:heat-inducible transcription repressor HrcA [Clostridia bacterium]
MELTPRKKAILKEVIDAFIATGEPQGSKTVMAKLRTPCSSATVRNEMNALEEMGLLEQPHTSAGRIPTRRGYRIYIDSLMENYRLSFEETLLLNSLVNDAGSDSEKFCSDMADLLAKMTGYAVLCFSRESIGTIERFDGVYISPHSFLLVMITSAGKAITKQLHTEIPLSAENVAFILRVVGEHLGKKELGGITMERMVAMEKDLGEFRFLIVPLLQLIYEMMADSGKETVSVRGLANLFTDPEFLTPQKGEKLLRQLEDHRDLADRFRSEFPTALRVHIAGKGEGLDGTSFVSCPFRLKNGPEGVLCVIGPKRMDYAKAMARLEYLAKQIHAVHGFEPTLPLIETKEK